MKQGIALLLTALLLTGCGAKDAPAEGQSTDGELQTISVVLDWYPNAVHTFLYEAQEQGYFAEEGLDLEILYPANPTDPLTMTAAGKADFGLYYQADTVMAKANEGIPVKVVGAVVQNPLDVICALSDQNIRTPADLKGKTVGYTGVPLVETALEDVLASADLTMEDIDLVNVGFDLMSAMTTGNVNATYGCFINHEIPAFTEQGFETDILFPTDYGVPSDYALVMVTGEQNLEKNRDAYTRFLTACRKGFADMKQDPESALQLLLANQDVDNFPLTESVERESFQVLLPMMETADAPFLSQSAEKWQDSIDWLLDHGMIDQAFDPAEIMVDLLAE